MRGTGKLRFLRNGALAILLGAYALQCSADNGNSAGGAANGGGGSGATAGKGGKGGTAGTGGIKIPEGGPLPDYTWEQFFANDPPPANCTDAGVPPYDAGGTPDCPDDKHLQGCPCTTTGETAPCWPGLRKNRNHGDCHDGTTTCVQSAEFDKAWGPCEGYTGISPPTYLPPEGATGKAACLCFSGGYWNVKNTSPCFYYSGAVGGPVMGGVSTIFDGTNARCPTTAEINLTTDWASATAPTQPFSPDTIKVDCNGYFKLCFTMKALSAKGAPKNSATDCQLVTICSEGWYDGAGQGPNGTDLEKPFPDLPSWITKTSTANACADAFDKNGGYGEFSVKGTSAECDTVDKIFLTFDYCPSSCNGPTPPPECAQCGTGTGGPF